MQAASTPWARRILTAFTAAVLGVGAVTTVLVTAPAAVADTTPTDPTVPVTASADPLPTVQQNGVVWAQVVVGNTVYVTGSFSSARPAGSAAGTNEVPRSNLLAYDITTGNLITSFNHNLNAQGLAITASPDGSRVYVGGDFTTVDGIKRNRIAAFDTATGALVTNFAPSASSQVAAIAATNSAVYFAGNFFTVSTQPRQRLAEVQASDGALLSWAPSADDNLVSAMAFTPDRSRLIIGGRFTTLSGINAYGLGAVDATLGAVVPLAVNNQVRDYGDAAGILSLTTDGTKMYATGFSFIAQGGAVEGNFEGTVAFDPYSGAISWLDDCHGDTYSAFPVNGILYSVSHVHDCSAIGEFPDPNPRTWRHAIAVPTNPTGDLAGTNTGPDTYGWNYAGIPDSRLLHWYPTLGIGSVTGSAQAAWSITGNSNYLTLGGEFPTANGVKQAGLVRYAVKAIAPNKVGPANSNGLTPNVVSLASGTARVSWQTTWDQDNETLTYKVYRDNSGTPIYTTTSKSSFWQLPTIGFTDSGLAPGSTHNYRVRVYDSYNNTTNGGATSVVVSSTGGSTSQYAKDVAADGATDYWRLGESSGSVGYDSAGFNDLTEGSTVGHDAVGAISDSAASSFDGSSTGGASTTSTVAGPNTFTQELWLSTTSTSGGKLIGFGDQLTGSNSSNYDRQLYMDNAGHVIFGVYSNGVRTISSPQTYNDGIFHHVVSSLSTAGMALYVDGKRVAIDPLTTTGQPFNGYWRIGGDNLGAWPAQPSSNYINGSIDDVAIYPTALTIARIQQHYVDSGRSLNLPTAPADAYGKAVFNDQPTLFWRLNETGGSTAADASGNDQTGNYTGGVSYSAPSTVTTGSGTAVNLDGNNGLITSANTYPGTTVYSEELWFNTTSTSGGKLIGFGDNPTGDSSNYDRHVWMQDNGNLVFGTWTGQTNTITSPASYNDGAWHHMVATQGSDGMHLYVDGLQVGTNPATGAQSYTGYWRVGGDVTWFNASSKYINGSVDEVAVYPTELTASRVLAHYKASTAAANQAPTASFTSQCSGLSCSFDGTASSDSDGTIASYAWNFGDSSPADSGPTPVHAYSAAGSYSVSLTVTDDQGAAKTTTSTVTVTAPNQAPVAAFTSSCTNLTCGFDGTGSSDPDGTVAAYAWNFGDGGTATTGTASHTFTAGPHTVTLTVTDNKGAANSVSHDVTVTPANQAPVAAFTSSCTNLTCGFDGTGSSDPDGTVAAYAWNFGDGGTATTATASHTFTAGPHTVTLTVTDNKGATNSVSHDVTATPVPNQAPVATFTSSCTDSSCGFDGIGSTDPDGAVATYAWTFGDTGSGSGPNPSHSYTTPGTYTVTLTVTDDQGATNSVSHDVTATPAPFASDMFNRTVASGMGNADVGGSWTASTTTSVTPGAAVFSLAKAGGTSTGALAGVSRTDADVQVGLSTDKPGTGSGQMLSVIGRRVSSTIDYRAKVRITATNTVGISLVSENGATETVLTKETILGGVTYTAGTVLKVRLQVTGTSPTTLRLKVWPATGAEPAAWQQTVTDSVAALQVAGGVGLSMYLSGSSTTVGVSVRASNFTARATF